MNNEILINSWKDLGLSRGMNYLIIMQDLEDKEYFPVYFHNQNDCIRYQENIISESKIKVVQIIELIRYQ